MGIHSWQDIRWLIRFQAATRYLMLLGIHSHKSILSNIAAEDLLIRNQQQ